MAQQTRLNYYFDSSALAASASVARDLQAQGATDDNGTATDNVSPCKNLRVFNIGTTDLKLTLNNRQGYDIVPKGSIAIVEDDLISGFKLTNLSGSTAGEAYVVLDSVDTVLSLLRAASAARFA